jgi:tol-pal system protein YbgF
MEIRQPTRSRAVALALGCALSLGCASVAEQRKLEYQVNKMAAGTSPQDQARRLAELSSDVQKLQADLAEMRGRVEVAEHNAQQALDQAKSAREGAARAEAGATTPAATDESAPGDPETSSEGSASEELSLYRDAYDAWRTNDLAACVDRFGRFLQSFPSSKYADDAAFWLADCHYKQGDLKTAILRFDEVATRHPESDKAPEALFRQGEALVQMGPRFTKAAQKAFQRVVDNYPDSKRAKDARERLALIGG